MTRIEYDLIRDREPNLRLPHWYTLRGEWRQLVKNYNEAQLISGRTAKLLALEFPQLEGMPFKVWPNA